MTIFDTLGLLCSLIFLLPPTTGLRKAIEKHVKNVISSIQSFYVLVK